MPARSSTIVTALTAAALVAVGFLGYQASASAPADLRPHKTGNTAGKHPTRPGSGKKEHRPAEPKVPEASGTGKRIVYALGAKRVWLVGADGTASRTFTVSPSPVSPPMGTYPVTSRSVSVTGSDGIAIEHVVRFASVDGVVIGFSAAVDGSSPNPDASQRTGGIRESRADGGAMWGFAVNGTKVVVVA
ncbi:hypothetical protein [Streptomyces benahoarensis]|uniref:L,D-transpeptidase n=1 Tax=Streptomyces benahoarensis TaxID=2595054 RepID=A0A553Z363_9ACTN|nr:hypothetical protein [Streptomyces benahoarensis]TSB18551.1 hypothetical protein FNJ62_23995 [Streptomyces benahoarensis]TSB35925.1 hypothetical protein FNZ23_20410 [Streptomyces benahoarensis]